MSLVEMVIRGLDNEVRVHQVCLPHPVVEAAVCDLTSVRRILEAVAGTGTALPAGYRFLLSEEGPLENRPEARAKVNALARAVQMALRPRLLSSPRRRESAEQCRALCMNLLAKLASEDTGRVVNLARIGGFDETELRNQLSSLLTAANSELEGLDEAATAVNWFSLDATRATALPPLQKRALALWYLFCREFSSQYQRWPILQNSKRTGLDAFSAFALACFREYGEPQDAVSFQRIFRKLKETMDQTEENPSFGPRVCS